MVTQADLEVGRRAFVAGAGIALLAGPASLGYAHDGYPSTGELDSLLERVYREQLAQSPQTLTSLGLDTGTNSWARSALDDQSRSHRSRLTVLRRGWRAALDRIDRVALTGLAATSYDCVAYDLDRAIRLASAFSFGRDGFPQPYVLSQLGGTYLDVPDLLATQHIIGDRADAEAYLDRLHAFARGLDEETERARTDAAAGVVPPDFIIARAVPQIKRLQSRPVSQSDLVSTLVARTTTAGIPGDWAQRAAAIVTADITPALNRQITLLEKLRSTAGHEAGVRRLPNGAAYYRAAIGYQTTTTMSPEDIHRLGLHLVGEIAAKANSLFRAQGLAAGSVGQRYAALFKDPRFIFPNTDLGKEAIIDYLNDRVRAMTSRLPSLFGTLPRAALEIRRVPPAREAGATSGEYRDGSIDGARPGIYFINLRDTAEVPRWTLPTLTYHEGVPGHHLQGALLLETAGLSKIRRSLWFTAYGEGWALYAEQLAAESGMYADDPWGELGFLHDALLRAVRLVLDTGLHHHGWSRERAIQYFVSQLGDPVAYAATEVERYCVWPGQACSYMIGREVILRHRENARMALSGRFDIRRFHHAVLSAGPMPLEVLEKHLASWLAIERGQTG